MAVKDKELDAIRAIIDLLNPLDDAERSRVLEYVLRRLQMAAIHAPTGVASESMEAAAGPVTTRAVTDIRSFTAEKQPRSASDMVAVVAYYLSELAPPDDRSDTVNAAKVQKYFKMAAFPLPKALASVIPNAVAAGYLENVSRGEYRLNPVGYNLVVHRLPRSGSPGPAARSARSKRKGIRRGR